MQDNFLRFLLIIVEFLQEDLLLCSDFSEIVLHLIVTNVVLRHFNSLLLLCIWAFSRLISSSILLLFLADIFNLTSCCFFQLCKAHIGTFWVLLEDAVVGLLPCFQDVVQSWFSFCLSTINQISDLEALFSEFNNSLVVL